MQKNTKKTETIHICKKCNKEVLESERKITPDKFILLSQLCKSCYQKLKWRDMGSYIYLIFDNERKKVIYVGETTSYKQRLASHLHKHTIPNLEFKDFENNKYSITVYNLARLFNEDNNDKNLLANILCKSINHRTENEKQRIKKAELVRLCIENKLINKYNLEEKQVLTKFSSSEENILNTMELLIHECLKQIEIETNFRVNVFNLIFHEQKWEVKSKKFEVCIKKGIYISKGMNKMDSMVLKQLTTDLKVQNAEN